MKKALQILNGIALVATLAVNYLSNTGIIAGKTIADVSAKYENLFTPAGYAFSIWGIIYLGMLGFVFHYGPLFKQTEEKNTTINQVGWWFIISCIANSLWVIAWLTDALLISVILMIILLFSLLKIVVNTQMELYEAPLKKFLFLWWPFCIYAGWVSVALIADIAAYLTKIDWNGFGITPPIWTVIVLVIATAIHIVMIWRRNMREFALVAVWAFIAIAVATQQEQPAVYWAAIILAAIIFLNIAVHGFQNRKSNPFLYHSKYPNHEKQK